MIMKNYGNQYVKNDLNESSIPGMIADWDNTARKGYNGQVLTGVSIDIFEEYFEKLLKKIKMKTMFHLL